MCAIREAVTKVLSASTAAKHTWAASPRKPTLDRRQQSPANNAVFSTVLPKARLRVGAAATRVTRVRTRRTRGSITGVRSWRRCRLNVLRGPSVTAVTKPTRTYRG